MENSLYHFDKGLEQLGISLSEEQKQQFITFYEHLIETNKVMNLTAITQWEEVVQKHFLDSLSLTLAADLTKIETLIDVGTGAGFPGIPLKIAYPHLNITLLDSLQKRVHFLEDVIEKCGLTQIHAIHSRAEDLAQQGEYRETFDICTSRAVANLRSLSEYCLPFVKVGGRFISYKSGNVDEEISEAGRAIDILGGSLGGVKRFELPESDIARTLVIVDKRRACAKKYPRKAGCATSNPL